MHLIPVSFCSYGAKRTRHWQPQYYWLEVVECARRLLLASVIGSVASADSAVAPVLGLVISLAFVYSFHMRPYKREMDSTVALVLQYSLTLMFLSALMIKLDDSGSVVGDEPSDQAVFGVILTLLLLSGPISLTLMMLNSIYKFQAAERDKRRKVGSGKAKKKGIKRVKRKKKTDDAPPPATEIIDHLGTINGITGIPMSVLCLCGNNFKSDSKFCRNCGNRRMSVAEANGDKHLPGMNGFKPGDDAPVLGEETKDVDIDMQAAKVAKQMLSPAVTTSVVDDRPDSEQKQKQQEKQQKLEPSYLNYDDPLARAIGTSVKSSFNDGRSGEQRWKQQFKSIELGSKTSPNKVVICLIYWRGDLLVAFLVCSCFDS